MKAAKILCFYLLFLASVKSFGAKVVDTTALLKAIATHTAQDTARVNLLNKAGFILYRVKADQSFQYYLESYPLAKKLNYDKGIADAALGMGFYRRFRGELPPALSYTKEAAHIYARMHDTLNEIAADYNLMNAYRLQNDFAKSVALNFEGIKLAQEVHTDKWLILLYNLLGETFSRLGDMDKSFFYTNKALNIAQKNNDLDGIQHCYSGLGDAMERQNQWAKAVDYYERAAVIGLKINNKQAFMENSLAVADAKIHLKDYNSALQTAYTVLKDIKAVQNVGDIPFAHSVLAQAYLHMGHADSAVKYGVLSLRANQVRGEKFSISASSEVLAQAYASLGQYKDAFRYQVMYSNYRDSISEAQSLRRLDAIQYTNELDNKQSQIKILKSNADLISRESRQQKILLIFSIAGVVAAIVFSAVLLISYRQKLAANKQLQQQQEELKATQSQLIQSEKMASLGELTAGIAHEIQNPLNFVNNFAEVNCEMIDELKLELERGNIADALAIADDIRQNEEKISHHGKRADGIVKGMLQHSRASSNTKELTDINKLADEYLRLSYHGLRAKDKTFNAELVAQYDQALPELTIVPQDIGRVLLNLLNNAFYTVQQKQKTAGADYKPTVWLTTEQQGGQAVITIKDNGNGIPQEVIDKIMQPFFTTKPTGQGTGLGLSLSYDIVVKAHGGNITVDSKEGEYSSFKVSIPINT